MTTGPRSPLVHGASLALLLLLGWLVVAPLAGALVASLAGDAGPTLDGFRQFAARRSEWVALGQSLWLGLATVVVAAAVGIPLAVLVARVKLPGGRWLSALLALPSVLPPLVGVVAFLVLWGESGLVARLVQALSGRDEPPWRLDGPAAVLLVHGATMYVYFFLMTKAGLESLDAGSLEAAASLGAGPATRFRRVILPHLRPWLGGAALLTFLASLASFSAPYVFGGGWRVMTTQILSTRLNGDDRAAMVETVMLTALALGGAALLSLVERGRGAGRGGSKGSAPRPRELRGRATRLAATAAGWGAALLLLLPHATLLLLSFVPAGSWTVEPLPPVLSLGNWAKIAAEPDRLRPLVNSLAMASIATAGAVALSLLGAWLAVRRRAVGGRLLEGLLALPWAVPGTVLAIALAGLFSVHRPGMGRFVLIGTVVLLPLAYLVRSLPLVSRPLFAAMRGLDPSLEEAAASLGAGPARRLARLLVPLLRPALAAGAALAFATSLGDFLLSVVLYTWDTRPISLEILSSLREADLGLAAAFGVVLALLGAAAFRLGAEWEERSSRG